MEQFTFKRILSLTTKLILLLLLTWLLVHIFALLGVFVAVGFFIWWIFYPKFSLCFSCRVKKVGEYCNVCKSTVHSNTDRYPKSLKSALFNSSLILLMSFLSLIVVYIENSILQSIQNPKSPKTVSFVIPSEAQYRTGEIFPLKIQLTGIEVPINAVQADIGFDKERIEVVDISTKDSFATVFLQKEINNDLGYARISGGLPNPGFNAPSGLFSTVYLRGKKPGLAQIYFLDTSLVLANDGKGTNVIKEFSTMSYLITPEQLPTDELELQNTLILENVLGLEEEGTKDQILLFAEDENFDEVLGIESFKDAELIESVETKNIFDTILEILTEIDLFIMDRISWILSFFNITVPGINE